MRSLLARFACALALLGASTCATAAQLACTSTTTLEALVSCIVNQMPQRDSDGYVAPTTQQRTDFRTVAHQMMLGQCGFPLPSSLASNMQIRSFTDSQNGKSYCLLMEVQDGDDDGDDDGYVDKGWGTFIVDSNALREVSHQAPHPIYDGDTANQAIGIFKHTDSRSFLMCGAHRHANGSTGGCQASYGPADCAHNKANMFTAVNQELDSFYGTKAGSAIQWHGMSADTCGPVSAYMTQGFASAPAAGTKIQLLKVLIRADQRGWDVRDPSDGGCTLNATDNVQGRILNGVAYATACSTVAAAPAGDKFIHIEQQPGTYQVADNWAPAVRDTWSVTAHVSPSGDTYARDGSSATINYATSPEMQVRTSDVAGFSRQGFLKFDVSAYPAISGATLQIYAAQSGISEGLELEVHAVASTSWNEATLNWNNKPLMGTVLSSTTTSGTAYMLYEFDVSEYVAAEIAAGRTTVSFGLYNPSSASPYIKVPSSNATSNQPVLVIRH
jgi:hypothetical protein